MFITYLIGKDQKVSHHLVLPRLWGNRQCYTMLVEVQIGNNYPNGKKGHFPFNLQIFFLQTR